MSDKPDQPDKSSSGSPEGGFDDLDIDALLAEASSYTKQVADEVGAEQEPSPAPEPAVSSESLQEVEARIEASLRQLEELLRDAPTDEDKSSGDPVSEGDSASAKHDDPPQVDEFDTLDDADVPTFDDPSELKEKGKLAKPKPPKSDSESGNQITADADKVSLVGKIRQQAKRVFSALKSPKALLRNLAGQAPEWLVLMLDLIDRPFGGVSMRARRYIGYAAIGTTTTALAILLASFSV